MAAAVHHFEHVAPNQSCPATTDDKLTTMKFTSSLTDKHAAKGAERARKAMKGIREVRKTPEESHTGRGRGFEPCVSEEEGQAQGLGPP